MPTRENVNLNFSIFTVFLKNRNIISKMKRSKVTDYAALNDTLFCKRPVLIYLHARALFMFLLSSADFLQN